MRVAANATLAAAVGLAAQGAGAACILPKGKVTSVAPKAGPMGGVVRPPLPRPPKQSVDYPR
jgi:hypothetical protein